MQAQLNRKMRFSAVRKGFFVIIGCVVMAMIACMVVGIPGTSGQNTPPAQPSDNVKPVAVINTVPDVNNINTPDALQQAVGSTETLIQNSNEHLRRTKVGDGKFEFEDATATSGTGVTTTTQPILVKPLAATSKADVTDINTPSAIKQKVGTTKTLVKNQYRQLRRTKDANGTFEFEDITVVAKASINGGPVVTNGLVPGSTIGSVVPVGATTSSGDVISLAAATYSGTPTAAGCMDITLNYHRYNKYLWVVDTVYWTHLGLHWCAIGDHIGRTSDGKSANVPKVYWFSDLAPYTAPIGTVSWAGGNFWNGYPGRPLDSSWRVRAQQGVQQCIVKAGCTGMEYPFIWVDLHGNLTWLWDAGR